MNRTLALPVVLIALGFPSVSHAKATRLSAEQRKQLRAIPPSSEVRNTAQLPASILKEVGNPANPGEKWQVTDLVDEKLPWTRLIWAASAGNMYVVHYERGGFGHSYHVLLATWERDSPKAMVVWHAVTRGPIKTTTHSMPHWMATNSTTPPGTSAEGLSSLT